MSELVHTDLPEPVVAGDQHYKAKILAHHIFAGDILAHSKGHLRDMGAELRESMTSRMGTGVTSWLGTSTPTTLLRPVMGAIRTLTRPETTQCRRPDW